ncbi:MAG: sulfite exporter TauE/SafE family protein [bacterium]
MNIDPNFLIYIGVGFVAQLIDGALGMAYGVISNSFMLSLGFPPAVASATVHSAEVVLTGVSGFSHYKFGNVDRQLFLRLIIPGVIGGVLGAYILTHVPGNTIKPYIAIYLLGMGIFILIRGIRKMQEKEVRNPVFISGLGTVGGLCDAIGGGGWGPIVTSTIMARGHTPRKTIGSVNASEFFVTVAESITFILTIGFGYWKIMLGILIGGLIAAPLAAYVCKKIPARPLIIMVGILILLTSARTLYLVFK